MTTQLVPRIQRLHSGDIFILEQRRNKAACLDMHMDALRLTLTPLQTWTFINHPIKRSEATWMTETLSGKLLEFYISTQHAATYTRDPLPRTKNGVLRVANLISMEP